MFRYCVRHTGFVLLHTLLIIDGFTLWFHVMEGILATHRLVLNLLQAELRRRHFPSDTVPLGQVTQAAALQLSV